MKKIDLRLNWFLGGEVEVAPDVPDIPGIGGVLSVYIETVDDVPVLRATWKEIKSALDKGWLVLLVDRSSEDSTSCDMVTGAASDGNSGFIVYGQDGNNYVTDSADGQPMAGSDVDPFLPNA